MRRIVGLLTMAVAGFLGLVSVVSLFKLVVAVIAVFSSASAQGEIAAYSAGYVVGQAAVNMVLVLAVVLLFRVGLRLWRGPSAGVARQNPFDKLR